MDFNYGKTASIDIDAQRGFTPLCPNELPVPDGHNIVDALNLQAQHAKFRMASMDIHPNTALWIADEKHPQLSPITGYRDLDLYWNAHCIVGTEGANLLPGLPPIEEYDFVAFKGIFINKHPYGACYHDLHDNISTGLIQALNEAGVDTVIVGGLALECCVKMSALQLAKHFRVIVNLNACRAIGSPDAVIDEMKQAGVIVCFLSRPRLEWGKE